MISENLGAFLADFGVACEFGDLRATVILDTPDVNVLGERVQSTAFSMLYATRDLPALKHGDWVTVDGVQYDVINPSLIDDGRFSRAALQQT